ncbi:sulfatase [Siansivirga zeaxanthinifaciens]|uniref:Aryl-sulfate sulfohydrolase n=1 Tax=Siansivirga zeaxanthinifaciens CC-SAMT-1 TaxID=1454006 RepID=A0A0C5WH75_9FLAO|nr:sulfatase [Siansivirga zeaxanthinifaciens]AJR04504.1 aryl-sulfate sulfohydrolase [Siansivirga zeaxanthinifaciens CC-SAMT-1]
MRKVQIICAVFFVVISSLNAQSKDKTKPNILIINIDDMGWKDVGFMGSEYYETPNIDALAQQGMVFTNGYAASANCAPSRACLMTGLWTPRHGIYTVNSSERGKSQDRKLIPTPNTTILAPTHNIIPKVLKSNGYTTCHAGKWHLSHNPLEYGFDVNIGGSHAGAPQSYYPPYKNVKLEKGDSDYLTDLVMENAIKFVDTIAQPFFLYYSPYAVHTPIMPVKSLLDKYKKKPGSNGQDNPEYATMVENLDRNIGLLVKKLKEKNLFDNTLIVFTSDNGGVYGITKQKPLRAGKGSYYEGGIREPFFFVFSDKIKPNTQSDVPITNLDIFPTILEFAGIKNTGLTLDGNTLSAVLEGKTESLKRSLFWHFPIYLEAYNQKDNENRDPLFRTRPGSVIRKGNWKLHYYFEDNGVELYNLSKDIGEQINVAKENPKKREELLGILKNWWKQTNAPLPTMINPKYIN